MTCTWKYRTVALRMYVGDNVLQAGVCMHTHVHLLTCSNVCVSVFTLTTQDVRLTLHAWLWDSKEFYICA